MKPKVAVDFLCPLFFIRGGPYMPPIVSLTPVTLSLTAKKYQLFDADAHSPEDTNLLGFDRAR